jgi:hypothetical protein
MLIARSKSKSRNDGIFYQAIESNGGVTVHQMISPALYLKPEEPVDRCRGARQASGVVDVRVRDLG